MFWIGLVIGIVVGCVSGIVLISLVSANNIGESNDIESNIKKDKNEY